MVLAPLLKVDASVIVEYLVERTCQVGASIRSYDSWPSVSARHVVDECIHNLLCIGISFTRYRFDPSRKAVCEYDELVVLKIVRVSHGDDVDDDVVERVGSEC